MERETGMQECGIHRRNKEMRKGRKIWKGVEWSKTLDVAEACV